MEESYSGHELSELLAKPAPKISVMIITYNHAAFIAQAIESVLMQVTDFSVQICVIDDCSSDGAQDIIRGYASKYPDRISAFINKKNIGTLSPPPQKVFHKGFKALVGEYLAILEGDDYWTSSSKLQKQIDFLDANKDFVACSHNTIKVYDDNSMESHRFLYWEGTKRDHCIDDFVAMTSFFHTSSIVYRNVLKGVPPKVFKSKWSCDIFNTMAHVQYGKLCYMNEDMSVYRAHRGGNFSNLTATAGRIFNIEGLRRYNRWLRFRYLKGFCFSIRRLCFDLVDQAAAGRIPSLTNYQRFKYLAVGYFYGGVWNFLEKFPSFDPSNFWYGPRRTRQE